MHMKKNVENQVHLFIYFFTFFKTFLTFRKHLLHRRTRCTKQIILRQTAHSSHIYYHVCLRSTQGITSIQVWHVLSNIYYHTSLHFTKEITSRELRFFRVTITTHDLHSTKIYKHLTSSEYPLQYISLWSYVIPINQVTLRSHKFSRPYSYYDY
jgi:hypothetical protein